MPGIPEMNRMLLDKLKEKFSQIEISDYQPVAEIEKEHEARKAEALKLRVKTSSTKHGRSRKQILKDRKRRK